MSLQELIDALIEAREDGFTHVFVGDEHSTYDIERVEARNVNEGVGIIFS